MMRMMMITIIMIMMMNNDDDDDDDDMMMMMMMMNMAMMSMTIVMNNDDDENDDDDYDDDDHPLPFHSLSLFSKSFVSVVHKNLLMTPISHLKIYKELIQGAHVLVQGLVEGSYTLERSTIS